MDKLAPHRRPCLDCRVGGPSAATAFIECRSRKWLFDVSGHPWFPVIPVYRARTARSPFLAGPAGLVILAAAAYVQWFVLVPALFSACGPVEQSR